MRLSLILKVKKVRFITSQFTINKEPPSGGFFTSKGKHMKKSNSAGIVGYKNGTTENPYSYLLKYKIPAKFSAYDKLCSQYKYSYLYASGHVIDYEANELWVVFPADNGNILNWFVVYDLGSLNEKCYFSAGIRWTKNFAIVYEKNKRYLYCNDNKVANNIQNSSRLAKYDITNLPNNGAQLDPISVSNEYAGESVCEFGGFLFTNYGYVTQNNVSNDRVIQKLSTDMSYVGHFILPQSVAGGVSGEGNGLLYKRQGLVVGNGFVAVAYGGMTKYPFNGDINDRRCHQGIRILSADGQSVQCESLMHPQKLASLLSEKLGHPVNRIEHEGLFYSTITGKLTTIWHTGDFFYIVEAFSDAALALDCSSAAIHGDVIIPDKYIAYRTTRNANSYRNPITGAPLTSLYEIMDFMETFQIKEFTWFSSNNKDITFPDSFSPVGSSSISACEYTISRVNNVTSFVNGSTANKLYRWVIKTNATTGERSFQGPYGLSLTAQ